MNYDARTDHAGARQVILSKGHAAPLLYSVLAEAGFFSVDMLSTLRKIGSPLEGHPNMRRLPGVERRPVLSSGLSIGVGAALAPGSTTPTPRLRRHGDGELDEARYGGCMSAANTASDNLVLSSIKTAINRPPQPRTCSNLARSSRASSPSAGLPRKSTAHDLGEILAAFDKAKHIKGKPSAIVARTVKGYPIHTMLTSDPNHHGKPLTKEEAVQGLAMIG